MPRYRPGNWPWLAIGGLVVLNAVLLVALVARQPTLAVPVAAPTSPARSAGAEPSGPVSASPSASSSPGGSNGPGADGEPTPPGTRVLAVTGDRLGWRALVGSCRDEAVVEVTTDGGRTWRRTEPGVRALGRLKSYQEQRVFAIGADRRCRPTYAWLAGPELGWQRSRARADDIWFRLPADRDVVHAPGGHRTSPCSDGLADLAGLGGYHAAALCRSGRLRTTSDGGRHWTTVLADSGGRALNADDTEFAVARVVSSCPGLVVQRFDVNGRGLEDQTPRCRRTAQPTSPVAVAIGPSTTWLWSGDEVTVF